jgi:putative ABC transport system ATP-binding protein
MTHRDSSGAASTSGDSDGRLGQGSAQSQPADRVAQPVIIVERLSKVYSMGASRVAALHDVTLQITTGEFVAIQGPSGSGKSTFMNLLGCLDRPTGGRYWLAGMEVSRLPADMIADLRNRRIGFIFQGFNLLSRATALANVAQPLAYSGISKHERERRARRALQAVGLEGRIHHRPLQLSGGQQQRVAIARALVNAPSLLLADEPTGNLDSRTAVEIMAILQQLNAQGLTIVLVTHEPDIAAYTHRRIQFRDGRVVRDEAVQAPRSATDDLQHLLWEQSAQEAKEPRTTAVVREEPQ